MNSILELCTSQDKGGLELYFASLSYQLAHFYDLHLAVDRSHQLDEHLNSALPTLTLETHSAYMPFKTAKALARYIDTHHIALIHLHWNKDLALAVWAKRFSKHKPKIVLTRHMQFPSYKGSLYHRFIYSNIDHIIAVTHTMARDLRRFLPLSVQPPISTIYLGVDPVKKISEAKAESIRSKYAPKSCYLIGLFGRIDPQKGQDLLIDAMLLAKAKALPFKALIVGHAMSEAYLQSLQEKVSTLGLEAFVTFSGFVQNPREVMQACDVVLLATIEETFGLVLIEAMSVDVPVIGSNRGGVPEIIEDHQSGLLFQSEDADALFKAIKTFYDEPELAKTCVKNAHIRVRKLFNTQSHIKNLCHLFDQMLKESHE